jgi:hypothetical protein
MAYMDKVRAQAGQLAGKARQGLAQGQEKLDEYQAKRRADTLLRNLGAAFYAEQRYGGDREAVATALAAVDSHAAHHGRIDVTPRTPSFGAGGHEEGPAPTTSAEGAPPPQPATE